MSKRESKKLEILRAGIEVMKRQGYNGTSVKHIVEAAEVPKGSFYNYFESKEAFALAAIQYVGELSYTTAAQVLQSSCEPQQRLLAYFQQGAASACDHNFKMGCFLGNMCQEMSDSSETIRNGLRAVLRKHTSLIQDALVECGQDSDTAKITAEFLFNAWEGALMRMKSSRCRDPLDAFLNTLPKLIAA
ncbi:TetR family transcriptional regulator [Alteromonadaceae bacterium 2753L.S.0a.02]|nr:TetR family transcriptional regulator [Alteromonadaceae bacterium 2753L.S.0a.02]